MPGPVLHPIKQAIVNVLNSVPEIGKVQPYQRYASRNNKLDDFYKDEPKGQIRGWFVRQGSWRQSLQVASCSERTRIWRIQGFMSLNDDQQSEVVFDDLLERINAAFMADRTLGGTVKRIGDNNEYGIQLDDVGPVMFAGVLCHGAKLRLTTLTD